MFFSSGFPFGGDMGDAFGVEPRGPRKDVNTTHFYEILGVPKDSSSPDLKKAYRRLAVQHHPDKGGDPETFKELSRAYEVLSDPEKREQYDRYGEEGLEGGGSSEPQDIFDLFFGGGQKRGPAAKKKGEDIDTNLKVTLEQLYTGFTKKLAVNKEVLCPTCEGYGGPKDQIEKCRTCDGRGMRVQIRQMGPMIQQTQSKCNVCNGEGTSMPESKKCKQCHGVKTTKQRKILEVFIEPGAPQNHKCVFRGEADERPGELPGDVIFRFDQQDHPIFKRKGVDLYMEKSITLYEALTGYKFVLEHLDKRKLLIKTAPGEITKPGDIKCVEHEGMPYHKNPFVKGHLFVVINIMFPEPNFIDEKTKAALKKMLPQPPPLKIDEENPELEHHFVSNIKPGDGSAAGRPGEAYEEDDGTGGAAQRVQCRQQ